VVQIIVIAMSTAVYFPFVRAQDKAMLAEEMGEGSSDNDQTKEEEGEPALNN
jgi:PTS system cellobiose-specific IIC component